MKRVNHIQVCLRLIALVKPLTLWMILAIGMGFLGHLSATFIPVFGGYAILGLLGIDLSYTMIVIYVCIGTMAVWRGVFHYGEQACNHYIAFKLLAMLRDKVFKALRRLCPAKLDGREKGDLISVITADIELLEVFYAHTISPVVIAFLMTMCMSLFIGRYHVMLGLMAGLAYLCVGIVIPVMASRLCGENGLRFRSKAGELSGYLLDSLRGLSETIQYGQGKIRLEEINNKTKALAQDEERMKHNSGFNAAVTNTVILVFDMGMLFASVVLFRKGAIDFDGVLISTIAFMSSFGPVIALASLGSSLQNTFAAGSRVLEILDDEPVVREVFGNAEVEFSGAGTAGLSFAYDNEVILSEISLDIQQNSVLGIIGKSGSGKSTFLKLLMRFWDVQKGSITISGREIDGVNTSNLRNMESFMTQETHLFRDSIENNLRIAKHFATRKEIEAACIKASIHDFIIKLPKGYETSVGELGDTLSGGERQRMGLARAFLHNAPLMLLDEPTSNLDSLNEAVILKSIDEAREGKTIVMISHRQSTMGIADVVFSVECGRSS